MRNEKAAFLLAALTRLYEGDQKALMSDLLDALELNEAGTLPAPPRTAAKHETKMSQRTIILQVLKDGKEHNTAQIKRAAWKIDPNFPEDSLGAKLWNMCKQGDLLSRKDPNGKGKLYKLKS